jgi:hypothetical protein
MTRNKIYAIVEGHGEANRPQGSVKPATVVLISKLLTELHHWTLFSVEKRPPFRLPYGQFFRGDKLERAIRLHKSYEDCAALLILLDMDDDCAKEKSMELVTRIRAMESLPFSVSVTCAVREYEAWFLASLETIQPGHCYEGDPELRRDAKGWLKRHFGYRPTRDQSAYTEGLDIALALGRSRSFRRLYHAFEEIIEASQTGHCIISPQVGLTHSSC